MYGSGIGRAKVVMCCVYVAFNDKNMLDGRFGV
jgi:hypothetical protein